MKINQKKASGDEKKPKYKCIMLIRGKNKRLGFYHFFIKELYLKRRYYNANEKQKTSEGLLFIGEG